MFVYRDRDVFWAEVRTDKGTERKYLSCAAARYIFDQAVSRGAKPCSTFPILSSRRNEDMNTITHDVSPREFGAVTVGKNGRALRFAFVDVTPDLAQRWLNLNTEQNRRQSPAKKDAYKTMIKDGLWNALTGECIKFGVDGSLYDGQHRLEAVIASGKTVTMLVCWGVPAAAFHVLDQGWSRSKLWWKKPEVRAALLALLNYRNGAYVYAGKVTQAEMERALNTHEAAIQFAVSLFARREKGISTAQNAGIIARATYHADAPILIEFVEALYARRLASSENRQLIVTKLLGYWNRAANSHENLTTRYRKTERALQAFIRDEPVAKLYEASRELFPLPEEQSQQS